MVRILIRDEQGSVRKDVQKEQLPAALQSQGNTLWVDLTTVSLDVVEPILDGSFGFHPLAIDDALNETHVPKVDEWNGYLYVVLRAAELTNGDTERLVAPELDVFLGENFIVTYSREHIAAIDRVWNRCLEDDRWLERGSDYLLYRLADELVNEMIEVVEGMHASLNELEEQIFGESTPETLEDLFTLKRNILKLRRVVVPQRDVMQKLSRNDYDVLDEGDRIYFRDVYDHLLLLHDMLDELLILVSGALDTYLSVVNNRMNDVMKTLTVITAFFMPIAFITGFFGMNFFQAPGQLDAWTGRIVFFLIFAVMVFIPLLMYWWMRRRNWI